MMQSFALKDHADSFLPADKKWQLVWNDEFDGTELDTSKWNFRLNFWGQRFKAFTDEGVVLDGQSHLQLHLVKKDGYYCSPHLQTGSLTYDIPRDREGFWPFGKKQEAPCAGFFLACGKTGILSVSPDGNGEKDS